MKIKYLLSIGLLALSINAQTIALQPFATGFTSPLEITHPVNDTRLFVVQKGGLIRILNSNGTINSTPFLTVAGLSSGSEQGLLGLAFHPNYATNGLFFINYTNTAGDTVIAVATSCLAAGMKPHEMANIANLAGGLVCEMSGVVAIDKNKLLEEVLNESDGH